VFIRQTTSQQSHMGGSGRVRIPKDVVSFASLNCGERRWSWRRGRRGCSWEVLRTIRGYVTWTKTQLANNLRREGTSAHIEELQVQDILAADVLYSLMGRHCRPWFVLPRPPCCPWQRPPLRLDYYVHPSNYFDDLANCYFVSLHKMEYYKTSI